MVFITCSCSAGSTKALSYWWGLRCWESDREAVHLYEKKHKTCPHCPNLEEEADFVTVEIVHPLLTQRCHCYHSIPAADLHWNIPLLHCQLLSWGSLTNSTKRAGRKEKGKVAAVRGLAGQWYHSFYLREACSNVLWCSGLPGHRSWPAPRNKRVAPGAVLREFVFVMQSTALRVPGRDVALGDLGFML